jgi:hypothetical protein
MTGITIAAYGEGMMYPPKLAPNIAAIQTAGWTDIILGLFHVNDVGDISFNDTPIVTGVGTYVGSADWPGQLTQLLSGPGSTINMLLASFGGGGVGDFQNIQNIYEANGNSLLGTNLAANCLTLFATFPMISAIEVDVEDDYNEPSFVAFCQMLARYGFSITFCPYTNQSFWTRSLAALNQSNPNAVKWWDLQCYDGGAGNDPQQWADAIATAIPGFDTTGFIVAGDWVRNSGGQGDCPQGVEQLLSQFRGQACTGGAFLWTIDDIFWQGTQTPKPCGSNATMRDYVAAITQALG